MLIYKCLEIDSSSACIHWVQSDDGWLPPLTYADANAMLAAVAGVLAIVFIVRSSRKLIGY